MQISKAKRLEDMKQNNMQRSKYDYLYKQGFAVRKGPEGGYILYDPVTDKSFFMILLQMLMKR